MPEDKHSRRRPRTPPHHQEGCRYRQDSVSRKAEAECNLTTGSHDSEPTAQASLGFSARWPLLPRTSAVIAPRWLAWCLGWSPSSRQNSLSWTGGWIRMHRLELEPHLHSKAPKNVPPSCNQSPSPSAYITVSSQRPHAERQCARSSGRPNLKPSFLPSSLPLAPAETKGGN